MMESMCFCKVRSFQGAYRVFLILLCSHRSCMFEPHCLVRILCCCVRLRWPWTPDVHSYWRNSLSDRRNNPNIHARPRHSHRWEVYSRFRCRYALHDGPNLPVRNRAWTRPRSLRIHRISLPQLWLCTVRLGWIRILLRHAVGNLMERTLRRLSRSRNHPHNLDLLPP